MKLLCPWTGLLLACVLPACTALPSAPVRPAVYDFGPGDLMPAPAARPALPPIVLHEIAAPVALESAAMLYRLAYADAQQLRPYAHARWSMPPAQLVRQRLREALSRERAVLDPRETAAPLALRVELQEFSQLFNSAEQSSGLVRLRATLFAVKEGADTMMGKPVDADRLLREAEEIRARPRAGAHLPVPQNSFNLEEMEREYVLRVLASTRGHKARTAQILGISRPRLDRILARHDVGSDE